jgi:hypothetical protein
LATAEPPTAPVPDRYPNLRETDTDDYETRTRWNVQDAHATLILSHGPLFGGSKFTEDVAARSGNPSGTWTWTPRPSTMR